MVERLGDGVSRLPVQALLRVVLQRHAPDLEYADIARLLDVPLGTVKARIHHARRYVRQALAGAAPAREGRPSMP